MTSKPIIFCVFINKSYMLKAFSGSSLKFGLFLSIFTENTHHMLDIVSGTGTKNGKSMHILGRIYQQNLCICCGVERERENTVVVFLWFKQLGGFTEIVMTKGEGFQLRLNQDICFVSFFPLNFIC